MAHVINVVDNYIISEITANDRAVIKTNRQPDIMKREIEWLEFSNAHETKKLAILYELRSERIGYKDTIPVIGCIPVANEYLDLKGRQVPVMDAVTVLNIAEVVFIFSLWNILGRDEMITK